jgi:L-amino acid N-acyltransferase
LRRPPVSNAERNSGVALRRAINSDLPAITRIYNEAIQTTTATFDTKRQTVRQRARWFEKHGRRHPVIVAEVDGTLVGWGCISPWSDRAAYNITGETSFYVKSEFRGRGIGRKLKSHIADEARRLGYHSLIARVAEGSDASLHINKSAGYKHVGTMREVGRKFGKLLDVHILQKIL